MPLVPAKCPSCGDTIQVDKSQEAANCPSCGAAFIVEKAIKVYATILQAENIVINNGDGVTKENLLKAALNHAKRNDWPKAIDALDDALKRGDLGKLFSRLRQVLAVLNHNNKSRITDVGLRNITNLYKEALLIEAQAEDDSIAPEQAQVLVQRLGMAVFSGWLEYIEGITALLTNRATCAAGRQELNNLVAYIQEYLKWAEGAGQLLKEEQDAYPLRARSFWAEIMRHCLERLALHTDPNNLPKAAEVQRIYDLAEEYMQVKGMFRTHDFASFVIPIQKGGEGVHARAKKEVKTNKNHSSTIVYVSASEYEYCSCKVSDKDFSGCFKSIIAWILGISWSVVILANPVIGILGMVAFLGYAIYNSSQDGKVPWSLYEDWLRSPVQGTQPQKATYEEFCAWMKECAEIKEKREKAKQNKK